MRGLYLITNDDEFSLLYQKLQQALATKHVALLQYRRKKVNYSQQLQEIEQLKTLCHRYQTPLIINDTISLAQQFQLNVHLGQDDGEIVTARQCLGEQAIIGRTCLNSLDLARQAVQDGANYIAFGAMYVSSSKQTLVSNIGLEIIQQARREFPKISICTIGGLTMENAQPVIDAGADMCAVIGDVLNRPLEHVAERVEQWVTLF